MVTPALTARPLAPLRAPGAAMAEVFKHSRYAGLVVPNFPSKYACCKRHGHARELTPYEVAEMRRHIAWIRWECGLPEQQMRRAVV